MLQTTIHAILSKDVDVSPYKLYLVRNDNDTVLYVGQSANIANRIRQHISEHAHPLGSLLGRVIYDHKPHSDNWTVTAYTVDDCSGLIKKYFSVLPIPENVVARYAEDALIHEHDPIYNRTVNTGFALPTDISSRFLERLKREGEEKQKRLEQKTIEKRARAVNGTCEICGEHDTSVNFLGEKCGLIEGPIGRTGNGIGRCTPM